MSEPSPQWRAGLVFADASDTGHSAAVFVDGEDTGDSLVFEALPGLQLLSPSLEDGLKISLIDLRSVGKVSAGVSVVVFVFDAVRRMAEVLNCDIAGRLNLPAFAERCF